MMFPDSPIFLFSLKIMDSHGIHCICSIFYKIFLKYVLNFMP